MKKIVLFALFALFAAQALTGPAKAEEHRHHHATPTKLELNQGKKWETDAPLRQAMDHINQAMAAALPAIHGNRLDDAGYEALAAKIEEETAYAIAHCKLSPRADAVLHVILGDLSAGSSAMAGKGSMSRHGGAAKVLEALRAYGRHFRHPGWKPAAG